MWQDVFLATMGWVLVLSLMPTTLSKSQKPEFISCVLTTLCLIGIVTIYHSLGLVAASLATSAQAIQWTILGIQRYKLNRKHQNHHLHFWK